MIALRSLSTVSDSPDVAEWLNPERLTKFDEVFGQTLPILRRSGAYVPLLKYWIREQISSEIADTSSISETSIESEIIAWRKKESKSLYKLSDVDCRLKVTLGPSCLLWAKNRWSHKVHSLYLENKSRLDKASLSMLKISDKYFAFEIYHRLKNNELTFKDALDSLASQLDSSASGYFRLQPLEKLPFGLNNVVPNLKVGEYSYPLKLGEGFCIIALESFVPSSLDVDTQELLLLQYLDQWIDAAVKHLIFLYDGYH